MEFPQIRLQSQQALIQIKKTPASQSIQQPKAVQSIEQPKAELTIDRKPPKLTIDQTEAWADLGRKSIPRLTDEAAQKGKQAVNESTARRVREGVDLMKIEIGGNPIASHAKQNSEGPPKQFNIGWIPSAGSVKINYQPSEVSINVTPQKPTITTQAEKVITNYQPGTVEISLRQHQDLQIDFVNLKHNGINFEMMI